MTTPAPDPTQLLKCLPLFQELLPEQLQAIAAASRQRRLSRGGMLFQKGDPAHGFYVVVSGQIKLAFPSLQGNEKVIEILGPQQSFGEAVMFMGRPYPVFAEAMSESLLLCIGGEAVFALLERDPGFARRMLAGLSLRLHTLVQDIETYSQRSATQRLVGFLLQLYPQGASGSHEIRLPASKQVIASRLNLTPETLSRIFHELSNSGVIEVHGKTVVIPDLTRLREYDL
ncbi:MAG: Crp/Fnr family transcriptional regulator [Betaproteobacteria bacterium HGW-Betaproteobacteria-11]|nr:MAG: Crp/Fnr family transcriptional regulator [Betaproteobacteria bacterium HGW-Betaproteobacteria-11]